MIICRLKINVILHVFFDVLERYCKYVILSTLGIPGYAHSKRYHELVENFHFYLQTKNQLYPLCFSEDSEKLCKLLISSTWPGRSSRPDVFCKKGVLKKLQNSHENTCVRVSF